MLRGVSVMSIGHCVRLRRLMPISSWNIGAMACNASLSTVSAMVIALKVFKYSTGTRSFSWKKSVM